MHNPLVLGCALALTLALSCIAAQQQQFPLPVNYDTTLTSPINPNITISFKQPTAGTCATAFGTQKQYSGYVNLPPFTLAPYQQNYTINTFFWFFESRISPETAPLTVWLNGGPGSSSMIGLFQEMGPCEIVQLVNGSYSTQSRLFGWDRSSNLLFIDQPTQTGFSYDERVNASVDLDNRNPFMLESRLPLQPLLPTQPAWRVKNGTFSSGRFDQTQNTTAIAARACWHFLQGFLSAFPQYNPGQRPNQTTTEPSGVNLFAESYGGIYGSAFGDLFQKQNDRRTSGFLPDTTLEIRLDSVGIINGILDLVVESNSIANFMHNNTYSISAIDSLAYQNAISALNSEGGCRDLVTRCRFRMQTFDSEGSGVDKETNMLCSKALASCSGVAGHLYYLSHRSPYDIRLSSDIGDSAAYQEYLNRADVMQSIGAQVNYTQSSAAVLEAFSIVGDSARGTQLSSLATLLDRGVRVAFIYGDADIICNWLGGQNASLEVARLLPGYETTFPAAGYAPIVINTTYVGGHVRQFGNLSFSRIFDAGHLVPLYQPETAFTVFSRIIQGDDIGTGQNVDLSSFGTVGIMDSSEHRNEVPEAPNRQCWIRDVIDTCTVDEIAAISRGEGGVENGVWRPAPAPAPAPAPGRPTDTAERISSTITKHTSKAASTTAQLTGVFTATETPKTTTTMASKPKTGTASSMQAWAGKEIWSTVMAFGVFWLGTYL